jgi:hypothetical protein
MSDDFDIEPLCECPDPGPRPTPCPKCGRHVLFSVRNGFAPPRAPEGAQAPTVHARTLVPAFCDADPLAPSAGAVRLAFRAHLLWFNAAGFAVLQWQQLPELVGDDRERIKLSLCELYSRAYFETCFAAHFDRADPQSDMHVLRAIAELFGPKLAEEVHAAVAAHGPVRQEKKP